MCAMLKPCILCGGDGFYKAGHLPGDLEDKKDGVYHKFWVSRTDGSHKKGKKHCGCPYFVLDMKHDKFAPAALRAYAAACKRELPGLSLDLRVAATELEKRLSATSLSTTAPEGHVRIPRVRVERETSPRDASRGALLVNVGMKTVWVPKYCIHDDSSVYRLGTSGVLIIPLEMAEEKNLV